MLTLTSPFSSTFHPAFLTMGCWGLSCIVSAQTPEQLDNLIFDVSLIEPATPTITPSATIKGLSSFSAGSWLSSYTSPATGENASFSTLQDVELIDYPAQEVKDYQGAINNLERSEGQFAPALIQHLVSLASLLQQFNQHEQAIVLFERAEHITRMNNGLFNLQQIPVIEKLIESYVAVDDFTAASDKERYLLFLSTKMKESDNDAMVNSLSGLGDNNMKRFAEALLEGEVKGSGLKISTLPSMSGIPDIEDPSRNYAVNSLFRANKTYFKALSNIINSQQVLDPQLFGLEYKFLETLFLLGYRYELVQEPHYYLTRARYDFNTGMRWKFLRRNEISYFRGIQAFQRILFYLELDSSVGNKNRVKAILEFGDWHLLFDRPDAAKEKYKAAYALALELEMRPTEIESLFRPAYPLQLPLFTVKPNSREKFSIPLNEPLAFDGYIDIAFDITENGTARRFKILHKSDNTTLAVEKRLKLYLKNSPFRPQVINGEVSRRETLNLRYFYTFLM